jgi:hypothetical protein
MLNLLLYSAEFLPVGPCRPPISTILEMPGGKLFRIACQILRIGNIKKE